MRTTEAARYARWSVTVAILMALGVAGVYAWRAVESRQAQASQPPPVPAAVQQHSAEFSYSKVVGNDTRFIVRASNATEFKERGRTLLDNVWITAFGGNGKRADQLRTASCEFLADSGIVSCPQQVTIDLQGSAGGSANGPSAAGAPVHVVTTHLNFNRATGVATTEDPVEFQFADGEGHALGLIYDSDHGELHLLHNVEMVFQAAPSSAPGPAATTPGPAAAGPAGPMAVSGDELVYRRDDRFIHLSGSAKMRRDRQELQAGLIMMELDTQLKARRLLASEHPVLHNPAADTDVTLAADELEAPLNAAGQMQSVAANGHVAVDALRSDGRHHLSASSGLLELIPETQQPRHFSAAGSVDVTSRAPDGARRHLQTPQLEVYFTGGAGGDSRMDRATAANGSIDWAGPTGSSGASAETMNIKGQFLDGSFDAAGVLRELRGKGGVEVRKQAAGEAAITSTSKELLVSVGPDGMWTTMDQTGDVHLANATGDARGDRARFNRAEDTVNLAGNVVISDDSSQTRAQSAVYRQGQGELRAEGNVFTTETSKDKSNGAAENSDPTHITSERMVSNTQTGHALYSGKARMWQGSSVIQADTIDLDRRDSTLIAVGKVKAVFPQASSGASPSASHKQSASNNGYWHAEAGRLTYEQGQSRARLEQNARATSTDGTVQADRLDLFLAQQGGGQESGQTAPVRRAGLESSLEGQQVQRAQGFGRVRVDSGDRTGTGERGDYSAVDGKFVLSGGRPAIIDKFGNTTAGRQLTFFFADDRIVVDSEEGSRTLTLHRVEK